VGVLGGSNVEKCFVSRQAGLSLNKNITVHGSAIITYLSTTMETRGPRGP